VKAVAVGKVDVTPVVEAVSMPKSLGVEDSATLQSTWSWVPPRRDVDGQLKPEAMREDDEVIAVIKGVLLEPEEIQEALTKLGGEDAVVVKLKQRMDTITAMVFVTGRSTRHLRKMADIVVKALKARGLKQATGSTGAEGEKDDDWLLVDCYNCVVHFMLVKTRTSLELEKHWSMDERPSMPARAGRVGLRDYEDAYEILLEQHPIPDDYDVREKERDDKNAVIRRL